MSTLSEYIERESSIFNKTQHLFQLEIKCFDRVDLANKEVAKAIGTGQTLDADVADFMLQLWLVVHSYLRTPFLMILRGQNQEAFAPLRTAIEMTSHLGIVGLSPVENSMIWVKQKNKEYKGKYKNIFKGFPREIPGMQDLEKAYYRCCDIGAHAGEMQLAGRSELDKKSGEYVFYSHNVSGDQVCGALTYILEIVFRCLYIFHFCFEKTLTKDGLRPVSNAVKLAMDEIEKTISLRKKQRSAKFPK